MKKKRNTIRNQRFSIAFSYLNSYQGVENQKQLAALMQMSEDSITRVKKGGTVTENFLARFQAATKYVFNIQWLRGESDIMLAEDVENQQSIVNPQQSTSMQVPDYGSLMNATLAAQEATIASLKRELAAQEESSRKAEASAKQEVAKAEASAKRELAAKQETIDALLGQLKDKNAQLADKDSYIATLKQQVADLRATVSRLQAKDYLGNYPFPIGAAEDMSHQPAAK